MQKQQLSPNESPRRYGFARVAGILAVILCAAVFISAFPSLSAKAESGNAFFGLAEFFGLNSTQQSKIETPQNAAGNDNLVPTLVTRTVCASGCDLPTIAAAVAEVNAAVPAGGVTYNVAAGHTETAPAGGFTITATGTMTDQIVFQKSGMGANPTVTASAAHTAGILHDAIFEIVGGDYITIDGFTMLENPANTVTTAASNTMTEFGVALFYNTATDGAQNVTIRNNTIDLDRTYQNTFGIYSNSTHTATTVTTSATATGANGGNNNLKIYSNAITDVNLGIVVVGPTTAADNSEGLDIGGAGIATGNTITNYGTTGTFSGYANVSGTVNGILVRNTKNFNVSYNTVTSSNGGTTAGTLNGIQVPAFSNAPTGTITNNINNNNISVRSGLIAGAINGILVAGTTANATTTFNINANDFSNSGHTVAGTGAITFLSNGSTGNININDNKFTNLSVNTTGSVTFISNSVSRLAGTTANANNNSIVTAFNKTGAGGTVRCYDSFGSSPATVTENNTGNNFSNITLTGATTFDCWRSADGSTSAPFGSNKNVSNNTFTNITGGTSAITILTVGYSNSASTTNNVSGNVINNVTGGAAITGITSPTATQNFFSNTVNTLASSGASAVSALTLTGGAVQSVYKNKFYDLSNTNAGGTVNGILISTAPTTGNIYNNLIGDLRTPAATSATTPVATDAIRGISITATTAATTLNVSFNTIYLNATSTGANFSSSALFATTSATATAATLNLRNNILVNLSTPTGTGIAAAYRRSSADLTNYGSVSNNNDFYAGMPGATRLIFYDGTNSDQTLAQYKARVAPRDAASVSENPNFLTTTGADTNFLHINPATPTQLESGGTPVAGITDDYDGDARNGSAPDIGADEFTGMGIDLSAPTITYTTFGNTTLTDNRVLNVTITDISGVAGGANSPRIYFRKNGGAYFSTQCSGTAPNYTCTIDYSLVGGVTTGDVIDYFVVAQDTVGNVGANPGAGFAATSVNNVTSPPTTPNTYTIVGGAPATINVGSGETITSLTNAGGVFQTLNSSVITNNVTINITSDLTAETGAVALNQLTEEGAGAGTYTVTIKPSGAARIISGTNGTGAIIRLNGADRVTIDGSLSGGTDRSLTITNNSTATSTAAIQIASAGVGAGAVNNTIKNTNLSCGADQSTSTNVTYGISHGGALLGNGGADNDNNSFINNAITKVNIGIYSSGENAANPVQNTVISNNLIGPAAFGSDQIGRAGIIFNQTNNAQVIGNEVRFVGVLDAQTSSGGSYDKFGITHAFNGWSETLAGGDLAVTNTLIARNKVHDIVEENTFSAVGIFMAGGNGTADTLNKTVNNFIWNVRANGTSGDNSVSLGIASGKGDTVAYNSIYMAGDLDPLASAASTTASYGIQIPNTTVTNLNLKNNIAFVDLTSSSTTTLVNAVIRIPTAFNWGTGGSDYNDLYAPAANTQTIIGRVGTTDAATLAAYRTASGQEANSKSVDPLFVSTTDLHLQAGSPMLGMATPIVGVTTDIDGETRDPMPDIGADEIVSFVAPTLQFSAATYSGNEGTTATINVTRTGDTGSASTVQYATSNGTATGGAACGAGVDYVSTSGTLTFATGETTKSFTVQFCSDAVLKGDETVNLTLSNATGATLGTPATAVLTITNTTLPQAGTLALSSATYTVGEAAGTLTVTVNRTGGSDGAVTVAYALAGGTATGGASCGGAVDYVNAGGTVNFANGETTKTFAVTICNDAALEGNETFNVTLSNATGGATIGSPSTAVVTITDDEVAQPGILALSSATYTVGEAAGNVTVTVNRTGGSDGAVAVNYTLSGGTATGGASCAAGVDYINTGGTVNFANGETTKTFTVAICNDAALEGNETFNVTLSGATGGATIGSPATAVVTINDDEVAQPGSLAFTVANSSISESGGSISLTVTRFGGSDGAVTVDYTLGGGLATGGATCAAGIDYINTGGTLNFANGQTTQSFNVQICNDALNEFNEAFNATLVNPTGGATLGNPSVQPISIIDDDPLPTLSINDVSMAEGNSGTTAFVFTVTLSAPSGRQLTVNYDTANGTATAGSDYTAISGPQLTFNPGETTKQITVNVIGDTLNETDETFFVNLSNASFATIADGQGLGTIQNDDAQPTISINDVSQAEGNAGTTNFTFNVTLSAASGQTVTVVYSTANGTATAGSDYTAIPNTTLTFNPGETTKQVTVVVNGDTTVEPDETFFVNLATPTNATIADPQGLGTIVNDDTFVPGTLSISDAQVTEGNSGTTTATFTVTLAGNSGQPASVQYATADGTATAGSDYVATSGTLNFAAGETTKTITVTVNGDTIREANEFFFVNLSNPTGATIADGQGVGTIVDNDRAYIADFDRDGKSDLSVYRPSDNTWYILQSTNGIPQFREFGAAGDVPVPGDYDGDAITDLAVFRPSTGTWYALQSSNFVVTQQQWGLGTDKLVQGDYDGDGKTDFAVFRPSLGAWFIIRSSTGTAVSVQFGANGDIPVQGDYDGDAKTDVAVFRAGNWYVLRSSDNAFVAQQWGLGSDKPLVGDFDGDGRADFTVYRDGVWYILSTLTGNYRAVSFGLGSDIPVPADYDGDGSSDVAVFRPSTGSWFIVRSSDGVYYGAQWGQNLDVPVPAAYQSR